MLTKPDGSELPQQDGNEHKTQPDCQARPTHWLGCQVQHDEQQQNQEQHEARMEEHISPPVTAVKTAKVSSQPQDDEDQQNHTQWAPAYIAAVPLGVPNTTKSYRQNQQHN